MIGMISFNKYLVVIFREKESEELTGAKIGLFGVKIWTRIGRNCLGLLQTQTMSNINEVVKQVLSIINEEM
jgi:hypothetical protein